MDIKTRLTRCCGKPVGGYKCGDGIRCPDCFDKLQGWREIETLRDALVCVVAYWDEWKDAPPSHTTALSLEEVANIARAALKGK